MTFLSALYMNSSRFQMKLLLLSLCVSCTLAVLTLNRQSYTRLPYRFVNGDFAQPEYAMFQDAAVKAAYHITDRFLYVACECYYHSFIYRTNTIFIDLGIIVYKIEFLHF